MSNALPLRIDNVTLRYPNGKLALRQLSLSVSPGEVIGLVGPNGAGKSSLLKCAAGLLFPQAGRIFCGNEDVTRDSRATARHLTLMPDPLGIYLDISSADYLEFFARALEIPLAERKSRIESTVEKLGLGPWLEHDVETLSAGWQRRLSLGRVLLADTPILLLDEPAAGLDVSARSDLLRIVRNIATSGKTVIITSHILPELEQLADRFMIIEDGQWIKAGENDLSVTRRDLQSGFGNSLWQIETSDNSRARQILGDKTVDGTEPETFLLRASDRDDAANHLANLVGNGIKIYNFKQTGNSLTDLTLKVLHSLPPPPPPSR